VLLVVLLFLLQIGVAAPAYGWPDPAIALIAGLMVTRWMK